MAATKKKGASTAPKRQTLASVKEMNERLQNRLNKIEDGAYCHMCDTFKPADSFYVNYNPAIKSGLSFICKQCARNIAERVDEHGKYHAPTKESLILALRYLDKPFYESLYNSSIQESENLIAGKVKENFARSYFKNIQMGQYRGYTFADSDFFKQSIKYEDEKTPEDIKNADVGTYDQYVKDKSDVIRLIHYDPFEKESVDDQPFLYSQLLGMLDSDENANDDMLRTSSIISIVRCFLQMSKIDDSISQIMSDAKNMQSNAPGIKTLQATKSDIQKVITNLAAESCISLKNSKNAKKGENTWTGKLKKLKDLNLREEAINGFDIGTCKGMQQVADISMNAIINSLRLDESEEKEIIIEQRQKISKLIREADAYAEAARILLKENLDLRETLKSNGLLDEENLLELDEVVNSYTSVKNEKI